MFFIWNFLKKIKEKKEKIKIIKDIIEIVSIDQIQKNLYLESLEIIADENLDSLYRQLVALTQILEEKEAIDLYKWNIIQKTEEQQEKQRELNSLQILLDNV
jgi:hypothetical protein